MALNTLVQVCKVNLITFPTISWSTVISPGAKAEVASTGARIRHAHACLKCQRILLPSASYAVDGGRASGWVGADGCCGLFHRSDRFLARSLFMQKCSGSPAPKNP